MAINVQASLFTSGPAIRFAGDTIVSTVVVGNTGAGANAAATGTVISIPVPSGATRTSWTREDRGTPSGTSAATTSGTGAIAQSLDWDSGEYSIWTVIDVLPGLAGSTYQLTGAVTPPVGNLSAVAGLAGLLVTTGSAISCFESEDGVQLRLTDASPRHLSGALVLDNATVEVANGVVRARISPHARGSTVANPIGLDPDGTGLNSSEGLGASSLGIGLAMSGSVLSWKGVTHPTASQALTVNAAATLRLTNAQAHSVIPMLGFLWSGQVNSNASGVLNCVVRLSHPGTVNTAVTPATNASSIHGAYEVNGAGNGVLYNNLRFRGLDLVGPVIPAGSWYEWSLYPQVVSGSSPNGSITAWAVGLAINP